MSQTEGINYQMDNQSSKEECSSPHANLPDLISQNNQLLLQRSSIIIFLQGNFQHIFIGIDTDSQDHHFTSPFDHFGP